MTRKAPAHTQPLSFAYALKSFTGFLEGTGKSKLTIESYLRDLQTFRGFLENRFGAQDISLKRLQTSDLDSYQDYLKASGLKANTRRRKVLTVRRLFTYLTKRNRLSVNVSHNLPAPTKVERIPQTFDYHDLGVKIRALPESAALEIRNKALLWLLWESGAAVREVCPLEFSAIETHAAGFAIAMGLRDRRSVPISTELRALFQKLFDVSVSERWMFMGFNKAGPLGGAITARGVELLVKAYGVKLEIPTLTPRGIRHSTVTHWLKRGDSEDDVQARLGLKSDYAFRVYRPLVRAAADGAKNRNLSDTISEEHNTDHVGHSRTK